jgi:hypothetical protein
MNPFTLIAIIMIFAAEEDWKGVGKFLHDHGKIV